MAGRPPAQPATAHQCGDVSCDECALLGSSKAPVQATTTMSPHCVVIVGTQIRGLTKRRAHTAGHTHGGHADTRYTHTLYTRQCLPMFGVPHVLAASQTHPKADATAAVPGKADARGYER